MRSSDEEFRELADRIQDHPGRVAHQRWKSLRSTHRILERNMAELAKLIRVAEKPPANLQMLFISNVDQEALAFQDDYFEELARLLHNYVASVGTLVDHSRNLIRNYEGTELATEYEARLEKVREKPVTGFIKRLRNYTLHSGMPSLGLQHSWTREGDGFRETHTVFFEKSKMLEWSGWGGARQYLQEKGDTVPYRDIIQEYADAIESLYEWLYGQFESVHGAEIDEVNNLIQEQQRFFPSEE